MDGVLKMIISKTKILDSIILTAFHTAIKEVIAEILNDLERIDQPDDNDGITMESINKQIEEVYNKWELKFGEYI